MKQKIKIAVIILIILVLSFFYAHIDKNTYLYDREVDSGDYAATGILLENEEISQDFVCEEDSIDGINIKITVYGNADETEVQYRIVDKENGQTLGEGTAAGESVKNNKFNKLKMDQIDGTKGKQCTLIIQEKGSDEENGLGFYTIGDSENTTVIRENETRGSLAVRMVCRRFDLETFVVLVGFVAFIWAFMKVLFKLFK